ncbi:hypothetical protein MOO46_07720 (plasmid) [Apilactobacillus apisilvae]|uniref:Uncharacterized protein n=1 Tax=Apilactobacillus apisilvae TaxID=2923364 RepID=A0ABY4PJV3_9LACO|nr:hypothetical protein [Apilactobacillus apisilvae]UQS85868.1 hypothetical protein MOO46_07720 [Apilactobacillus apisilvae]
MAKRKNAKKATGKRKTVNFFITNHKNKTAELPVAPSAVKIRSETGDSVSTVIGLGEINRIGGQKLKSISISGFLPVNSKHIPYVTVRKKNRWKLATSYITFLKNIEKSKKPCRFLVSNAHISLKMTISAFEYGMADGNADEYQYTIEFKEYRPIKAERIHKVSKKKHAKKGVRRSKPQHKINRGSKVTVNGLAYLSKNATYGVQIRKQTCKITLVSKGKHPYYVVNTSGTPMGWISRSAML